MTQNTVKQKDRQMHMLHARYTLRRSMHASVQNEKFSPKSIALRGLYGPCDGPCVAGFSIVVGYNFYARQHIVLSAY